MRGKARYFLGIESTAHTFGIGIYDAKTKKMLANERALYRPCSQGFIPRELAEHHQRNAKEVLRRALSKASLSLEEIDYFAVSQGPGIGSPLKLGMAFAKYLASFYDKKLIPVHHPLAHIKILEYEKKVEKNYVVIYVSGANTQIIWKEKEMSYLILGETLDIGIGNLFDNFARKLSLSPPNGSSLERLAIRAKKRRAFEVMPYTVKGMNVAFSGLLTYAVRRYEEEVKKVEKEEKQKEKLAKRIERVKERLAYSLMHTAFSMVLETAERALHLKNAKAFGVVGGVAQSVLLKEMVKKLSQENKIAFYFPKPEFAGDNGGMIAYTASLLVDKALKPERVEAKPYLRLEEYLEWVGR